MVPGGHRPASPIVVVGHGCAGGAMFGELSDPGVATFGALLDPVLEDIPGEMLGETPGVDVVAPGVVLTTPGVVVITPGCVPNVPPTTPGEDGGVPSTPGELGAPRA